MRGTSLALTLALLLLAPAAPAQQDDRKAQLANIVAALEKNGCTELGRSQITICMYDYEWKGKRVEAISFRPANDKPLPGLVLLPGHQRTARDYIPTGVNFAREGFAVVAITLPGYGRTEVEPDYVGPRTIEVLAAGYEKFKREPFVDPTRVGIYGYSRGAMAASLLVTHLDDVAAAVFGAWIYDFKKAHDETKIEGIKRNMEREAGLTKEAVAARSSVLRMERLRCPVLILHGEEDENAPVSQAILLRDRLKALGKEFEVEIYPGEGHGLGPKATTRAIEFFKRRLASQPSKS